MFLWPRLLKVPIKPYFNPILVLTYSKCPANAYIPETQGRHATTAPKTP